MSTFNVMDGPAVSGIRVFLYVFLFFVIFLIYLGQF
jgi:hypothetical protein